MKQDCISRVNSTNGCRRAAFSLIEMIGVVAIIAILASAITSVILRRIDIAATNKEYADLASISNALTLQILRSNSIPDQTGWAQAAANWSGRPVSLITSNNRGFRRYYAIDPNLRLPGFSLPYTQGISNGLSGRPTSARLMIVSTLARTNAPLSDGVVSSSNNFNAIWDTTAGGKPSTWAGFPGPGDDICIQRINLEPLFFQLILNNRDRYSLAKFSINTNTAFNVPTNSLNCFYLDGTEVGLCDSNGIPSTRFILKRNSSFVFENGAWYGQLLNGPPLTNINSAFMAAAAAFFNSSWNPDANTGGGRSVDQGAVLGSMINFMQAYTMWANDTPHFNHYNLANISKLQVWVLLDREGAGTDPDNKGNLSDFSSGLLAP
jgi:prepilin-type N-terminal cleavage/methylation domain-containing protein